MKHLLSVFALQERVRYSNFIYFGTKVEIIASANTKVPIVNTIKKLVRNNILLLIVFLLPQISCAQTEKQVLAESIKEQKIITGAERTEVYLPLLKKKRVAIVGNQTSIIGDTHLVDTLLSLGVRVKKIFAPEHGFRGTADAGAHIKTQKDEKTGLPLISLYGKNYKPLPADLKNVDIVIFDIQDVGARFYTYISTLHYIMEACAETGKKLIVMDRPNPNGHYVDGPVLEEKFKSFVGMHPVPIVYGLTIGEYAEMINGEGWLKNKIKCDLTVVKIENYDHTKFYKLPVKPSPNLPNMTAIYLYPSLALFEGTVISVGRGTDFPFQVVGHPQLKDLKFTFTPKSKPGATNPMLRDSLCFGYDLRNLPDSFLQKEVKFSLLWLRETYKDYIWQQPDPGEGGGYFNNYFNSLAGNSSLKQHIIEENGEDIIRETWEPALAEFKKIRKKYLLYSDFE